MIVSKRVYIIGGVTSLLLIALITLIIVFSASSSDDNLATNPPNTIDPDEIPLPFTNALIVKINNSTLWARDIDSDNSIYLIKNWTTTFYSFDFNRKKNIYFGSTVKGEAITSYSKKYSQLTQPGIWFASKIAMDYVHEKLYVIDGLAEKINMFDIESDYYNVISIDLNQPKNIAVDPIERYLFVQQISSIVRTNLDGTIPETIVEKIVISAFQIDVNKKRIYWATTSDIQGVDYTGKNLIIVEEITNTVVSLAVAKNNLFWLNVSNNNENPSLSLCKVINGVCNETTSTIFYENAVELKAYNFNKLQVPNPCSSTSHCEHMCVNSNNKPRCVCTVGWQLKNDSQNCEMIDEFLLYVEGEYVKGRVLDFTKDAAFTTAILPFKLNVTLLSRYKEFVFDFDVRSREFIFSDDYSLSKINLRPDSRQVFIGGDSKDKFINPVVDWVTKNVYYVRWIYYDFYSIVIRNLEPYDNSKADKVIIPFFDSQTPRSLAVHPNRGFLFVTLLNDINEKSMQILRANLDGTNRIVFSKNLSISDMENGFAIDYEDDRLFWFDKDLQKVHSSDLECSNLQSIDVSIIKNPTMINVYSNYIYISNLTSIWRFDKKTGRNVLKVLPIFGYESQSIRGAKVFSEKSQVIDANHPCVVNNGGCKRYCLAKSSSSTNKLERECQCNNDESLDSDGKNCISFS